MTSMNHTFWPPGALAVSTDWIMPKLEPLPWPKITSAPAAITASVTRLPPAASL